MLLFPPPTGSPVLKITNHLSELREAEHENTVQIVAALVVCWNERAYLPLGHASMWAYLTDGLKYSPGAAARRLKAMKCALNFPQVIDMLRDHRVNLSTLAKAESLLSESRSAADLLDRISGKSAAQVETVIATARPKPTRPRERVARVAVKHEDPLFAENPEPAEPRVSVRTTLTEDRYDAFEKARAIISRKVPGATVEQVLNELVDHYLKSKAPRNETRLKKVGKPETSSPKARNRRIPKATRDVVMLRDREQCTFVGRDGHRCTAKNNLQIDHIRPWALGGTHDPSNLRVLCAAHNRYRSQQTFGPKRSPQRIKEKEKEKAEQTPATPDPPAPPAPGVARARPSPRY
jgi:5-methylcytosine-specific restriction endonuclease McrA